MSAAAAVAATAAVISAAIGATGALAQGKAAKDQAQTQANLLKYNETVNRTNAQMAAEQAAAAEEQQRRKFAQVQGQAYAATAQSGTGFDGSNLDLLRQNEINNELDALNIRYAGQNNVKGLLVQADSNALQSEMSINAGKAAQTGSYFSAGSQLIGGIGTAAYYSKGGSADSKKSN